MLSLIINVLLAGINFYSTMVYYNEKSYGWMTFSAIFAIWCTINSFKVVHLLDDNKKIERWDEKD